MLLRADRRRVGRAAAAPACASTFRSRLRARAARRSVPGRVARSSGVRASCRAARITSAVWPRCREPLQQPCACERPQLRAERFRRRDQQVSQLAETGTLGVDRAFSCGHQRLQRLAFAACPWRRRPLVGEHAAGGTDGVSASVLPPERRSRRSRPTSSTRSPRPVRKRVRPAPNEPVPSIAKTRRPGACSSPSTSTCR